MLDEPRARLALLTGDVETAHRLALIATDRRSTVSPVRRLEMSLVIAVALLRQGRFDVAVPPLRRAVYSATALGVLSPFAASRALTCRYWPATFRNSARCSATSCSTSS